MSKTERSRCSGLTLLAVTMLLGGVAPVPQAAGADLFVASRDTSSIKRYDGTTGAFLGDFVSVGPTGGPTSMALGPDGNLYVAGGGDTAPNIKRYDGSTGDFIDTFISIAPGANILDIVFGPDGTLYASVFESFVIRVDGSTGALLGTIGAGSPLSRPAGLAFGADGNLYVSNYNFNPTLPNQILRFNATNGTYIDVFATVPIVCPAGCPVDISFGPDGNLYAQVNFSESIPTDIWRFDGTTGASLGPFIPAEDPHPFFPGFMAFGPDGNLYITSRATDQVLRYDGATGDFVDVFASGGGLDHPVGLVFIDPACADGIDNDGDGQTDFGADLGCESEEDADEKGAAAAGGWALVCDDGVDQDGDGLVDYPEDPGCFSAAGYTESPRCNDGADNDGDGSIDHPADPECKTPWDTSELHAGSQCGIGFELAFVLPPLLWLRQRRQRARTAQV